MYPDFTKARYRAAFISFDDTLLSNVTNGTFVEICQPSLGVHITETIVGPVTKTQNKVSFVLSDQTTVDISLSDDTIIYRSGDLVGGFPIIQGRQDRNTCRLDFKSAGFGGARVSFWDRHLSELQADDPVAIWQPSIGLDILGHIFGQVVYTNDTVEFMLTKLDFKKINIKIYDEHDGTGRLTYSFEDPPNDYGGFCLRDLGDNNGSDQN